METINKCDDEKLFKNIPQHHSRPKSKRIDLSKATQINSARNNLWNTLLNTEIQISTEKILFF